MTRNLVIDGYAREQQELASSPQRSAWVSANAGSGKTYVLAQRVVRLLLSGVDPSRILCLTYTKAAAGEMSNRVFEILGKWVSLPDAKLREELAAIERRQASGEQLARARILFARALETPGGLKVQTIHAFCEALLHQFPLEANIPGSFKVMDDQMQTAGFAGTSGGRETDAFRSRQCCRYCLCEIDSCGWRFADRQGA